MSFVLEARQRAWLRSQGTMLALSKLKGKVALLDIDDRARRLVEEAITRASNEALAEFMTEHGDG